MVTNPAHPEAGEPEYLTIPEAAASLDVKTSTVYAYISRGLLRSHRSPGVRRSWLSRADVEEFRRRHGARQVVDGSDSPVTAPESTSVTAIVEDRLLYRGRDATQLATSESFESVAEWLWTGTAAPARPWVVDAGKVQVLYDIQRAVPKGGLPMDRLKVTTALLGLMDPVRYDLSTPSVLSAARTLIIVLVDALPVGDDSGEVRAPGAGVAARLWQRLAPSPPREDNVRLLSAALVLLADHGLAPSTRAVRSAASLAADPYSAVLAGMGVASGLLHGGSSLATQAWLNDIDTPDRAAHVLGDRLRWGDRLSGFGQPRYRHGDPRAALLLRLLGDTCPDRVRLDIVHAVMDLVRERRGLQPNVEFALGALCFVHDMAYGAGEAIFVTARCAGWLAHAMEEYALGTTNLRGSRG